MRAPLSWIRELVDLPSDVDGRTLAEELIRLGLEVETVDVIGEVAGDIVVGQVMDISELTEFRKPIRFCQVDVGPQHGGQRGIICGATNFVLGDIVVVALPGAVLPGPFAITARKTYGHLSDGMICSSRELGIGEDHDGIIVLAPGTADPGEDARSVLGLGEEVLDIAVTPDRGYALSIRGIAREAAIAYDIPFRDSVADLVPLAQPDPRAVPVGCASDDFEHCDVFTLRTVTGVDARAATPHWMRQRLIAAGMRPVNILVDITNYVMIETGQPLHAFDVAKLKGSLTARLAATGERLETLDHVVRELHAGDLVIADDAGPVALAGTMGGLATEISDSATTVAIEAAHFNPVTVARMARRHKLSTEASRRFERGVDPTLAASASARAMQLIVELTGGTSMGLTGHEAPRASTTIRLPLDLPSTVAGFTIDPELVERHLQSVGCIVEPSRRGPDYRKVTPPPWRADLVDPADLVEEVVRLVGYDSIPSQLPQVPAGHGLTRAQVLRRRASKVLAAQGLTEVLNYPFLGVDDLDRCLVDAGDPRRALVTLANPLSAQQPNFRTTVLPGLLQTARRNLGRGAEAVALYEMGAVAIDRAAGQQQSDAGGWDRAASGPERTPAPRPLVTSRPDPVELEALEAALPVQFTSVSAVWVGAIETGGWWGAGRTAEWSDAVSAAVEFVAQIGVVARVEQAEHAPFHPGRCAAIVVDDIIVGHAGELHPQVVRSWELPGRPVGFELDLDAVIAAVGDHVTPAPVFSTMPVAKEDVAVVVDAGISAQAIQDALVDGAGPLLESIRLFDIYTGPQLGEGKKSLAFALRFRAVDRTLDLDEVSAARDAAVACANRLYGAMIRA